MSGEINNDNETWLMPPALANEPWVQRYQDTGILPFVVEAGTSEDEKRFDGLTNLEHAMKVKDLIANNTNIPVGLVPAFQLAVIIHDTIFKRQGRAPKRYNKGNEAEMSDAQRGEDDKAPARANQPEFSQMTRNILVALADYANEPYISSDPSVIVSHAERQNKVVEVLYAIGIAVSANKWEEAGETWRQMVYEWVSTGKSGMDLAFLDEQMGASIGNDPSDQDEYRRSILLALESGAAPVTPAMLKFRGPTLDFEHVLSNYGDEFDLEGLPIKAAEVIHNLSPGHRNLEKPASSWRDAIELLSLYGPLLEALGFDQLAALAYGTAYEYLYQGTDTIKEAGVLHRIATMFWNGDGSQEGKGIGPDIIEGINRIIGISVIDHRVKHIGSISDKIEKGKGIPDLIGLRCLIQDCKSKDPRVVKKHLERNIKLVTEVILAYGFTLGDPRGVPAVDIKERAFSVAKKIHMKGPGGLKLPVTAEGATDDGYQASHLVFKLRGDDNTLITLEVQLLTNDQDYNRKNNAAHVFYKMLHGSGPLGVARRSMEIFLRERDELRERLSQDQATGKKKKKIAGEIERLEELEGLIVKARSRFSQEKKKMIGILHMYAKRFDRFMGDVSEYQHFLNHGTIALLNHNLTHELLSFHDISEIELMLSIKEGMKEP